MGYVSIRTGDERSLDAAHEYSPHSVREPYGRIAARYLYMYGKSASRIQLD